MEGPGERTLRLAFWLLAIGLVLAVLGVLAFSWYTAPDQSAVLKAMSLLLTVCGLMLLGSVAAAGFSIVELRRHGRPTRGAWWVAMAGVLVALAYWYLLAPINAAIRADLGW